MRFAFPTIFLSLAAPAMAEAPRVATDILPVHSLVARVMEGVGEPDLILPPGASPHGYSMRPSEAASLEQADIVFWIGSGLTPWLERPIEVVADDALTIALLEQPETLIIEYAEDDVHGHDDHAKEGHDDHDDHGHDDHAEEGHDGHDDHGHEDHAEGGHDGHDHGPIDPHAWLDPENGKLWLGIIENALVAADPDNAATYAANAAAGRAEIDALVEEIKTAFSEDAAQPYAVYHNAYSYFEQRFDITPTAKLLDSEASQPSPQRIAEAREIVTSQGVQHVFTEPGTNVSLIETIFDGVPVTVCEIDPMGSSTPAGPKHYWQSMRALAAMFDGCDGS